MSGFMHLSATMVATSLEDDSKFAFLSFSETCNSPLDKICREANATIVNEITMIYVILKEVVVN